MSHICAFIVFPSTWMLLVENLTPTVLKVKLILSKSRQEIALSNTRSFSKVVIFVVAGTRREAQE